MPNAMGRPRMIKSVEEFDRLVDEYIVDCKLNDEPLRVTGLVLFMGFASVSSLDDYGRRPGFEEFTASVKRARLLVEDSYVKRAINGEGAGPIFLLKASYGYVDRQTVDMNQTGEIKVVLDEKDLKA